MFEGGVRGVAAEVGVEVGMEVGAEMGAEVQLKVLFSLSRSRSPESYQKSLHAQ